MKFSAGCLQWPPTEASRCYEFNRQTHDVLNQNLEQRDVLCFQNEHSDERLEQHQQEPTIRASREQSQPLHQYRRRLRKEFMAKGKIDAEPEFAALVGIDWADRKHVWCLQAAGSGQREPGELEHKVEAVEAWVAELCRRFDHRPIAVAVEQVKGALVFLLNKYECLHIFPVPSTMTAKMREALYPSGAKDDPRDADLLLELLWQHRDKLRRLSPDDEATRRVQSLVEERRKLMAEKTAQGNRLISYLKIYFPQMVEWFEKLDIPLVCDLLERWPTLEELQKISAEELRAFFRQHHCHRGLMERRILAIGGAIPAKGDRAVIEAKSAVVKVIVQLIRSLLEGIAELDRKIEEAAAEHPDFSFSSRCRERVRCWPRACWLRLARNEIVTAVPPNCRPTVGSRR